MRHFVVIDDDHAFGSLILDICRDEGFEVQYFDDPDIALASIRAMPPLLVISDVFLAGEPRGMLLAQQLRADARTATIPMVLTSVERSYLELQLPLIQQLGCDVLVKPFNIDHLVATLHSALDY